MKTLRIVFGWVLVVALVVYTALVVLGTQLPERLDAEAESMREY